MIAVIPARYGSTRLPAKALAEIERVPMIVRVCRQVSKARAIDRTIVATDDQRIADVVSRAGGEAMLTSPAHQSGTDRIAEVAQKVAADVYINVQGDLPFIDPADLDALAAPMRDDTSIAMATLATPIVDRHEWTNPNVVKVVCAANGDALYFSRASIPYPRDIDGTPAVARRHIGVYAFRRDFLLKFASLPQGALERIEKLEQLRALENGYAIRVVPSVAPSLEIDTAEDLARARAQASSARS
ncbi:MAG TPA: 3-deoxy-manno-octulosonate cytidylyltransferase [Candidatus Binataceae bacterium]|nr:3-deoxy-manno-octulosonate cytidylyltransferase [Candidatus Binataceae bacterium]